MMDDGHVPQIVKLYDVGRTKRYARPPYRRDIPAQALSSLQHEIETNLPEFQEMIMGLQ